MRQQRPVWRSPQHARHKHYQDEVGSDGPHDGGDARDSSKPRPRYSDSSPGSRQEDERQRATEVHRQDISRHRHHWAPPVTPPGYWDIGFPDTQTAAEINARAKEMEAKKFDQVQSEASREGGRFRKR